MPKASVAVPHSLGKDEAATRVKRMIEEVKQSYGDKIDDLDERVDGDSGVFSFAVQGVKLKASYAVTDREVTVDCDLPMLAAMFKGRIEEQLHDHLSRGLA